MRLEHWLRPQWQSPKNVQALITVRNPVLPNQPQPQIILPTAPTFLKQVHGTEIIRLPSAQLNPVADAAITSTPNVVCCIATADCLPILFTHKQGLEVGVIHAGWRGLAAGIIQHSLQQFTYQISDYLFWLAPCISEHAFEVEKDVVTSFLAEAWSEDLLSQAFIAKPNSPTKFLGNLRLLAQATLIAHGALNAQILVSDLCTYRDQDLFHSYRRDKTPERMHSLIWVGD